MVYKGKLSWLIFLIGSIVFNLSIANPVEGNLEAVSQADDDVVYDIDSLYDFLAARGRRSKDNDLFWANRGKRSHDIHTRDMVANHLKPNGFIFVMGKRSLLEPGMKKNALKPNGFNFLLAGKRSSGMLPRPNSFLFPVKREGFNIPRPNGFMFPQMGKRGSGLSNEEYFNSPKPSSFLWPSMKGKRTPDETRAAWRNMVRPTGFMFSMAKGKKSDEEGPEFFDEDAQMINDDNIVDEMDEMSTHFVDANEVDANDVETMEARERRSTMTSSSNAQPQDYHTFFAGRGKKDSRGSTAGSRSGSGPTKSSGDSFFAGRGKKGTDYDMFVAGRGK